jgi:hypothetical protein
MYCQKKRGSSSGVERAIRILEVRGPIPLSSKKSEVKCVFNDLLFWDCLYIRKQNCKVNVDQT